MKYKGGADSLLGKVIYSGLHYGIRISVIFLIFWDIMKLINFCVSCEFHPTPDNNNLEEYNLTYINLAINYFYKGHL